MKHETRRKDELFMLLVWRGLVWFDATVIAIRAGGAERRVEKLRMYMKTI